MKIPKKMRPAVKLKPAQDDDSVRQKADELGTAYKSASEEEKAAKRRKDDAAVTIKMLGRKAGIRVLKSLVVSGKIWTVGVTFCSQGSVLNLDKAKKKIPPELLKECYVKVLDPSKIALLAQKKKISGELFVSLLDEKPPIEKVLVERKENKTKAH